MGLLSWISDVSKESSLLPINLSNIWGSSGISPPDNQKDYIKLYEEDPWIKRSVDTIANIVSSCSHRVVDENGEEKDHVINDLIDKPNPDQSKVDFMIESSSFLDLGGETFWEIVTPNGVRIPKELYNMKPYRVNIVPNEKKTAIESYQYKVGNKKITMNKDEVAFLHTFHPTKDFRGMPSVKPLSHITTASQNMWNWIQKFTAGKGAGEGFLTTDEKIGESDHKRLKKQWTNVKSSDSKVALLPGGISWEQISRPPKESGLMDMQENVILNLIAPLGLFPGLIGLLESGQYVDLDTQLQVFFSITIVPKLMMFEGLINRQLMPRFPSTSEGDKFEFNKESVGLLSFPKLVEVLGDQFNSASLSPNEFIQMTGVGHPYEGGDEHYVGERKTRAGIEEIEDDNAPEDEVENEGEPEE